MASWLHSLKFQVTAVFLVLICLFAVSSYYVLNALRIQRQDEALLRLASEMQLIGQQLFMQAMNYQENAPRDYPTYYRDLRLYYRDLMDKTQRMSRIASLFSADPNLSDDDAMLAEFSESARAAAKHLGRYWTSFDEQLRQRLGEDLEEPRLERAAAYVEETGAELLDQITQFWEVLEAAGQRRSQAAQRLYRAVLAVTAVFAAGILLWFYSRVLRPLGNTIQGVGRVAAGDFSHRIPIETHNEIGGLNAAFNQLSGRLHTLLRLLTRLQGGSDLEETLGVMAEVLPELIPVDWTGILFITPDRNAQLEAAYLDGVAVKTRLLRFAASDTPLETALAKQEPQHIHDLQGLAASNPRYHLIRHLSKIGMRDAIFMPIKDPSAVPGVLVFATRQVNAYSTEQVALLSNLALLITLSFGKTLRLVERARLAAIGQFVSGIAHEIRNPLATITLALDHLKKGNLPPTSAKRVALAVEEGARLARLLDEMLFYAKPMRLNVKRLRVADLFADVFASSETLRNDPKAIEIHWPAAPSLEIAIDGDADRLRQVLLNLLQNAIDASAPGDKVRVAVAVHASAGEFEIAITNSGNAIPQADLDRLFEPFFSTKPAGIGLGLGIVRRIVHAHGGEVSFWSKSNQVTVTVTLPLSHAVV
jgi:signal transduction histidine kinase